MTAFVPPPGGEVHERPDAPAPPSASGITSTPIALPERSVDRDRLRGRKDLVKRLTQDIGNHLTRPGRTDGVWVLSGLGGSGKTTVALEVAHQLSETGAAARVWFVSAQHGKRPSGPLYAVAFDAGADSGAVGRGHEADVLWRQLEKLREPWLLVLDNVNEPALLAPAEEEPAAHTGEPAVDQGRRATPEERLAAGVGWLRRPRHLPGAVLITSLRSGRPPWPGWTTDVPVDVLGTEDSARILIDLAPQAGQEADARLLAADLGDLPLALNLVGSFLAHAIRAARMVALPGPKTFADYRRSFHERLGRRTAVPGPSPDEQVHGHLERINATWEVSLDLLRHHEQHAAGPLMMLLSALGPAPIPSLRLLDPELIAAGDLFASCRPSPVQVAEALEGLLGLHFLRDDGGARDHDPQSGTGARLTIHPLVRSSMRSRPDYHAHTRELLDLVVALLHGALRGLEPDTSAHWPQWQDLAPHCWAPLDLLTGGEAQDVVVAATEPALRAGQYRYYLGLYADARADLVTVVDVRQRRLGPEHPATLEARLSLALALRDEGRLDEAEEEYHAVARVCERTLPADHGLVQSARSGRARVLRELGRYEEAERELRTVLRIREAADPPDPRAVLRTRHDLATILHKRGALTEAIAELRTVWETNRAVLGDGDDLSLACGISLTRALRDAGRTDEAARVCSTVVGEIANYREPNHPDMLIAAHEQARIRRDQRLLETAESELRRIWQVNRDRFGEDHPDTVANRHELATVLHLLGRLDEAEHHFEAVLTANRRRFGDDHPNVRTCQDNLDFLRADMARRAAQAASPGADDTQETRAAAAEHAQEDRMNGDHDDPHSDAEAAGPSGAALADALAQAPSASDAASRRVVERFIRRRVSRGGSEPGGGGGYSTGSWEHASSSRGDSSPRVTYQAQPQTEKQAQTEKTRKNLPAGLPWVLHAYDAFDALATGAEDRGMIQRLAGSQRSIRIKVLRSLLEELEARERSEGTDRLPERVAHARTLLLEAGRAAPHSIDQLILDPAVGRWMSHLLGALRDGDGTPGLPVWAGSGHLFALAAAAGIRAGLTFTCRIPVHRSLAVLPTLGTADVGSHAEEVATVIAENGRATVWTPGTRVTLPASAEDASPGWRPLRRVTVGEYRSEMYLDDIHPLRNVTSPQEPGPLTEDLAARWAGLVHEAWRLLRDLGSRNAEALAAALTAITPLPPKGGPRMASLSSSDAFGGIVLSEPEDATELAETLTHEFRHMKLNAVLDIVDLYDERDDGGLYYAPWRDRPRPFEGLFQGVFAFYGVADHWYRVIRSARGTRLARARFELAYWRAQLRDTHALLRTSPRWTTAGSHFLARMHASGLLWDDEHVPEEIAALAAEAVVDHRSRWRLHHLRPDVRDVAEYTDSRLHGAAPPACPRRTVPALHPDPSARGLATGVAFLRRAAVDLEALRQQGMDAAPSEHGPFAADIARVVGDLDTARSLAVTHLAEDPECAGAWVALGLALRRTAQACPGDTEAQSAARALSHRPELVRAVHRSLREGTGTAIDPVSLAAWIDAPDADDPPPVHRP
ncbi:HEXXH motif-containing putative peptide modification protein [Streptomyces sp. Li-HN-5-11]|uniref:aKG-HExxH-type peptide beta-hydroxylase n=1 Tax=Streptomyces sp. Li-HN-5-11 TaxID=3075432 RepID=UPI0028ACD8E4|nr:HEXXH motif-containing putative peptide modification protein [Streptomyces sp. Li-HN-5-11]WNM32074.1 HEXXH motif-containing putative peptide modification protein [Streptomyces sp. Li-HN-5-11]